VNGGGGWLRLLLALYPADFRDEMGADWQATYRDRLRDARLRAGRRGAFAVGVRAVWDSLRNGLGERLRPAAGWRRPGSWGRDGQRAVRRLLRAPGFALAAVVTLTLGLGGFGVVYSAVEALLIEPPAYERPDDLYFVWRDYTWVPFTRGWLGGTDVAALREAGGVIAGVAGLDVETATPAGGAGGEPEELAVMLATANLFDLLGVPPALGRGFAPGEDGPDRPAVAVLGHDLWQRRFAGDPGVLGREILLDGEPFTVIGVTGPAFRFAAHSSLGPPRTADLYATFDLDLAATSPNSGSYGGLLRARPGSDPRTVAAAVDSVARGIDQRDFSGKGLELFTVGLWQDLVAPVRRAVTALGVAAAFLLVALAANLGALLLARTARREREIAVSRALGADRGALALATLLEGGLLGLAGGVAGTLLAIVGSRALVALAPAELPRRLEIGVDPSVAAAVVGAGVLLGLAAGAAPAVWAARTSLASLLGHSGVRGGGGHGRMGRGLVVAQVALSLALLSAGGLLVRSLEQLLAADPGFDPAGVLTVRVPLDGQRYPEAEGMRFQRRLVAALGELPGVGAAGAVSALPLSAMADQSDVRFPGAPGNTGVDEHDAPLVDVVRGMPGVFAALGMELVEGSGFSASPPEGVREVVIDEALARTFYPGTSAVGREADVGGTLRVVGVVRQARLYDVHQDGRPQIWVRNRDFPYATLHYLVRTSARPMDLAPAVRRTIHDLDPALPISELRTLDDVVADALRPQRLNTVLVAAFGLGALLLTVLGLYALVAGAVVRRRHEIGVRLALGAERGRVVRLLLRDGLALIALGVLLGVPGVYLAGRLLRGLVVGISPFDPATLAAVALGLALVAALACWLPARRVAAIDPARSLRAE
jgi:putative ABC transport system permease protein